MVYTVPPPDALQAAVMDFLRQGDAYIKPYRAAFKRDGIAGSAHLPKPVFIGAMDYDPLSGQLDRLAPLPEGSFKTLMGADRDAAIQMMAGWLKRYPADPPGPEPAPAAQGFCPSSGAQLFRRGRLEGRARPLVLLHDAGGSSQLFADSLRGAEGPVIAIDLPGHGESANAAPEGVRSVPDFADAISDALARLGLDDAAIAGFHLGGQIALELARRDVRIRPALIGAPVYRDEERTEFPMDYAPSIAPRADGGHMLTAWHFLRMRMLFFPWFRTTPAEAIPGEPHLDPAALTRQAVDMFKAGDRYRLAYGAQFGFDTSAALLQCPAAQLLAAPWDPLMHEPRWSVLKPDSRPVTMLSAAPAAWLPALQALRD
jgi:pimeloyl-ACP methyl ester carboxylesterase